MKASPKITLFCIIVLLTRTHGSAQHSAKREIMPVIESLFTAMETNDGPLAASVFTEHATLLTVKDSSEDSTQLTFTPVSHLVEVFAQPKKETLREPVWNEKILVDGDYAFVWINYAFYIGADFHHCGVDAFQLIHSANGWKIMSITDTRRSISCKIPKKVKRYMAGKTGA